MEGIRGLVVGQIIAFEPFKNGFFIFWVCGDLMDTNPLALKARCCRGSSLWCMS